MATVRINTATLMCKQPSSPYLAIVCALLPSSPYFAIAHAFRRRGFGAQAAALALPILAPRGGERHGERVRKTVESSVVLPKRATTGSTWKVEGIGLGTASGIEDRVREREANVEMR
uniref:Uncharacterized protein n=2 Tax=Oryza TaxID=4527 RepID=A0A0D3EYJ3_9ORYZ